MRTLEGEDSVVITDSAASAPSPPGNPVSLDALPSSGRISTRTRRRAAATDGTAPPAVDNGFGPGGAPRPSVRRAITPPRLPRPRPRASVVMAPVPVGSSVRTATIQSDRDRTEPVRTPLLRLPWPTDAPPVTATDLNTLGAAAEFQFGESAYALFARRLGSGTIDEARLRCGHALHRPWPAGGFARRVVSYFPSHLRPPGSEVQDLASKGRLHTTDVGIDLLVRQSSPPLEPGTQPTMGRTVCLLNHEPIRIYLPLLMHPRVMQACHSTAPCNLGTSRTRRILRHTFILVDRHEHLYPVVDKQLLEVPSKANVAADGPMDHHQIEFVRRARHRRQRRLLRPSPSNASR